MMDNNIHFKVIVWKIIPRLSLLLLHIWSSGPTFYELAYSSGRAIAIQEVQFRKSYCCTSDVGVSIGCDVWGGGSVSEMFKFYVKVLSDEQRAVK